MDQRPSITLAELAELIRPLCSRVVEMLKNTRVDAALLVALTALVLSQCK